MEFEFVTIITFLKFHIKWNLLSLSFNKSTSLMMSLSKSELGNLENFIQKSNLQTLAHSHQMVI